MARKSPKAWTETALWRSCSNLTADLEWQLSDLRGFSYERLVTWVHYPNRYLLTELASKKWLGKQIVTRMFSLESLAAKSVDTGLHKLSRYMVIRGELFAVTHSELPAPADMSEIDILQMREDAKFVLDNHLHVPNAEDRKFVEDALSDAHMDGVNPYVR